jgi:subtilisin family serine protease
MIISGKAFLHFSILLSLSFPIIWAGNEYPAKPGEAVAPDELIVRFKNGASARSIIPNYLPGAQIEALGRLNTYRVKNGFNISSTASNNLARHGLVEYVEPNRIRHTMLATPNDPMYSSQWPLQTLQALQAWGVLPNSYLTSTAAGNGTGRIKVAVLDTGVDCTHPDFINSGGNSTNAALGGQLLWSASQTLIPTTVANPACAWQDDYGHGTHVAGIIAAAASNTIGVAGVGYPLEVIAYKVLDSTGNGNDANIATAIMAAADAGAQVISLSLGGAGYSQTLQAAVNYAWQHNALVVAAAGNSSTSGLFFPAGANYAVGVSATDSTNAFANFSNYGPAIKIAAPGVAVLSTTPTYSAAGGFSLNYGTLSGTSMATPHVSAVAGLVGMTTPGTSAAAILQRIQESANSNTVGGGWDQQFGYGIVNAYNAVAGVLHPAANGGLIGQIVDTNALPVQGATVTVNGVSETVDSSGMYRFSLAAGAYPVGVAATGFSAHYLTANVVPGADTILTIQMGASYGNFTGTVRDNGVAMAGAMVQGLASGLIMGTAVADINGAYTLWLPAGTYDIRASAIGHANITVPSQTVAAGGSVTVNLASTRTGILSGAVRDLKLNPIAHAQISITGTTSTGATADSNGNYSIAGLSAGVYTVTAVASGFVPFTASNVIISADTTTASNFTLSPMAASQNVIWLPQGNATLSPDGTSVQKLSGCNGCGDAGGISQQQITSGDGYAEFTFGDTSFKEVGLHPAGTWFAAWIVQYGFIIWPTYVEVRENGVYRTDVSSAPGDVFRVQIIAGQVTYLKNGIVLYASSQAVSYPLAMQVRLSAINSTFGNARIFMSGGATGPAISSSTPMLSGTAGSAYSQTLTATGGTAPYSWSLASGSTLPTGLILSTGGVLSGTPATAGPSNFTVKVSDNNGLSATKLFSLTIAAALTITSGSPMVYGTTGSTYSQTLTATGGTAPYSWSLASGSTLPTGLNLSTGGVLSGTPATAGSSNFTVKITDNNGLSATKLLSLTIAAPLAITSSSTMPNGIAGSAYSQTLTATGGTTPYSWSLANGSTLPTGFSLSGGGVLSGTPATVGSSNFTVKITDNNGLSTTKLFSLTITGQLTVTSSSPMLGGTAGSAYSQTLTAAGGTPPYRWSLASGSAVPTGLSLSAGGVLGGTPATAGSSSFTVNVTDANSLSSAKLFSLTISGIAGGVTVQNVTWLPQGNATLSPDGTSVLKTVGCDGCSDAGGISRQQITSGDGYAEFTFGDTSFKEIGLHPAGTWFQAWIVQYGFITWPTYVEVRENGVYRTDVSSAPGDVFRVQITAGRVTYLKNGVVLYTSSQAVSYPLAMQVRLSALNSTFGNARMFTAGGISGPSVSSASPIVSGTVGSAYSQILGATGGTAPYSWSLASGSTLPAGLSLSTAGVLSGLPAMDGSYAFTVIVTDSANLGSAKLFNLTIGAGTALQNVTWLPQGNATLSPDGTSVQKVGRCDGCPDSGGISQQQISSGDGYAEFTFADTSFKQVGLHPAGTWFLSGAQFGFTIWPTYVEVRESGVYRTSVPAAPGDIFRVQITGGQVIYLKNGVPLYSSTQSVSYPLAMEVRLSILNSTFGSARILP